MYFCESHPVKFAAFHLTLSLRNNVASQVQKLILVFKQIINLHYPCGQINICQPVFWLLSAPTIPHCSGRTTSLLIISSSDKCIKYISTSLIGSSLCRRNKTKQTKPSECDFARCEQVETHHAMAACDLFIYLFIISSLGILEGSSCVCRRLHHNGVCCS